VNQERWLRVTDIFDAALACPADQRALYLARTCAGDDDLLSEVSRLLAEFDRAGDFLERPPTASRQAICTGEVIAGRYRVEALLGRGGMGEVYRVHDELLAERFALKTLRPELSGDPATLRRFQREIRSARKVTHPNVCRVFEVGVHLPDGSHNLGRLDFFVMQLLDGETLAARMHRQGPFSRNEAFPLILQLCEGLQAAHDAGIIHRDFKSSNVILCQGKAVITDFGLARAGTGAEAASVTGTITANNLIAGTLAYMSPEQLSGGEITTASDIYSLGVVMFEMATGRLLFDDRNIIQSAMQRAADAVPNIRALAPGVDRDWAAAIARCLQRDPEKRFRRAADVACFRAPALRIPAPSSLTQSTRRKWAGAAIISAAGVSVFGLRSRFFKQDDQLPPGIDALLTPIVNSTGDMRFAGITELFRSQVSQSAHLNFLSSDKLASQLKQMGKPDDIADASALREAAWRLNAGLSIFGNVSRIGSDYALNVQIETRGSQPDRPRAKLLRSFSASDPSALMGAVRGASLWVRETAGESASDISSFDRLPADATTPSWEALASFARGQRFFMQQDFESAILEFESALRVDPGFTLAALRRADLLFSENRQTQAFAQYRAAIAMLNKRPLTRAEELYARGMFAHDSGDLEAADRYYRTWSIEYPYDWRAPFYRVSSLCMNGEAIQALDLLQQLRRRMPEYGDIYAQMITCLLILGRTAEAQALVPELKKRNRPERADLREAYIRFREADCVGCLEILRSVEKSTSYRRGAADAMRQEGLLLIDAGYLEAAAANIEAFVRRGSWVEMASEQEALRVIQAWAELGSGQTKAAVAHARTAIEGDSGPMVTALAGTIFARSGAADLAERALRVCANNLDIRLYRIAHFRIQGEQAKAAGRVGRAIELLRGAAALEPKIAHRQYLIEALPASKPERMELCLNVLRIPWQNLRPPLIHHIGAIGMAVAAVNAAPGLNEPFAKKFAESSRTLGNAI
jgi:serine/threonine protein kinase/Tfp pilus assembly protein PilF